MIDAIIPYRKTKIIPSCASPLQDHAAHTCRVDSHQPNAGPYALGASAKMVNLLQDTTRN